MISRLILLPLLLTVSQQAFGQSTTVPPKEPEKADIVVEGRPDPDEPDPSNLRRKVIVGSRIPRYSLQNNPNIASATSLGVNVGLRHGCLAVDEHQTMEVVQGPRRGDQQARSLRFGSRAKSYGQDANRRSAKRRALNAMVDTGMMPEVEERLAVGTLASWALKADDTEAAIRWYRELASMNITDTQSRVNAGVLLGRVGKTEESKAQFRAAISAARKEGKMVPAEWVQRAK